MSILNQWIHKWFGIWREYGPAYASCPSVKDFVFPEVALKYDKARLRKYLTSAPIVASTSRRSFPCPFTGKQNTGSICFRSDGEWLWLDDLPDYIEQFNVAIPSALQRKIVDNGYVPPESVTIDMIGKLEWPPVSR